MTKKELIRGISAKSGLTQKDSEVFLSAFVDVLTEELNKGEKVKVKDLGVFEPKVIGARIGTLKQADGTVFEWETEASKGVKFSPSGILKDAINA